MICGSANRLVFVRLLASSVTVRNDSPLPLYVAAVAQRTHRFTSDETYPEFSSNERRRKFHAVPARAIDRVGAHVGQNLPQTKKASQALLVRPWFLWSWREDLNLLPPTPHAQLAYQPSCNGLNLRRCNRHDARRHPGAVLRPVVHHLSAPLEHVTSLIRTPRLVARLVGNRLVG